MENKVEKKKRSQDSKRLTLSELAQSNSTKWVNQITDEFKGMLDLKRNEVINFILEEMGASLSKDLLEKIRSKKLTDSHIAKWIYKKTLEAEKEGHEPNFDELVRAAQGSIKKAKRPRKTKNKTSQIEENIDSGLTALNDAKASI